MQLKGEEQLATAYFIPKLEIPGCSSCSRKIPEHFKELKQKRKNIFFILSLIFYSPCRKILELIVWNE
jgi:hypothetical protein